MKFPQDFNKEIQEKLIMTKTLECEVVSRRIWEVRGIRGFILLQYEENHGEMREKKCYILFDKILTHSD